MEENTSLYRVDLAEGKFDELSPCNASDISLKEKKIEEWVAHDPKLLFSNPEAVMIIAQEVSGEPQADLLAVDSQGTLIIIEIKRHWSDRSTVGQLLDYAARLSEWDYEAFNQRWRMHNGNQDKDLIDEFRKFIDNPEFDKEEFPKDRRLYILASEADEAMKRIIAWLRDRYKVPIDYVPFSFFRSGEEVFLLMQKIEVEPLESYGTWAGDWFFNTDETHDPGAWKRMLEHSIIAAGGYGEAITKHKMDLPSKGDRVFAYVNTVGIIAVGNVEEEESFKASTIFDQTDGNEFHRRVSWTSIVKPEMAVTAKESSQWGYNLPIRCTIGKMWNNKVAERIARELQKRTAVGDDDEGGCCG